MKQIRKFLLPFLIVMTFFLFTYLPGILTAHLDVGDHKKVLIVGLIGVNIMNIISDPLCYIFLQPKIKRQIKKYIKKTLPSSSSSKSSFAVTLSVITNENVVPPQPAAATNVAFENTHDGGLENNSKATDMNEDSTPPRAE